MERVTDGVGVIDLNFQGHDRVIATGVLETPSGVVLVDPGPPSCTSRLMEALRASGITARDLHALLLTHIHLDHAAAAGPLVRDVPSLKVYVHQRGAPHVIDPSKLLASAARLYGDEMEPLWGRIIPVPADSVTPLSGGEVLDFGGRHVEVADTPGHAHHHVSYFDGTSGVAFMGDTGGIRMPRSAVVMPPTPPPDIDPGLWRTSVERVRQWSPSRVFITHFGAFEDVSYHLRDLLDRLERYSRLAARLLASPGDDASRATAFVAALRADVQEQLGSQGESAYQGAIQFEHCWQGLARYWSRQAP